MAYSDYGAFIWKNGENITKQFADMSFVFKDGKWITEENFDNEYLHAGGHACLQLDDFCVEFYKTYEPVVALDSGERMTYNYKVSSKFVDLTNGLKMRAYNLDSIGSIIYCEVEYKEDNYLIIYGSCVGNGFERKKISKFLLKNVKYDEEFYIDSPIDDVAVVIDKIIRLDDINFERYLRYNFGIKLMLKDLLKLNFKGAIYYLKEIIEYNKKIRWLK